MPANSIKISNFLNRLHDTPPNRERRLVNFNSFSRASMLCKTVPWGGEKIKKSSENLISRIKRWATRKNVFPLLPLMLKNLAFAFKVNSLQQEIAQISRARFEEASKRPPSHNYSHFGLFDNAQLSFRSKTDQHSTSAARSKRLYGRESKRAVNLLCNLSFGRRNSRTWRRCPLSFVCQAFRLFIINFAHDGQSWARE